MVTPSSFACDCVMPLLLSETIAILLIFLNSPFGPSFFVVAGLRLSPGPPLFLMHAPALCVSPVTPAGAVRFPPDTFVCAFPGDLSAVFPDVTARHTCM